MLESGSSEFTQCVCVCVCYDLSYMATAFMFLYRIYLLNKDTATSEPGHISGSFEWLIISCTFNYFLGLSILRNSW